MQTDDGASVCQVGDVDGVPWHATCAATTTTRRLDRGAVHLPNPRPFATRPEFATLSRMARRSTLPGFEDLPLLLQAEEVASILRVSRKALYAMVERGEIPGVTRLGRRVRFRRDALEAWLIASMQ